MSLAPAPDAPIAAGTSKQHAKEPAAGARPEAHNPTDAPLAPELLSLSSLDDRLVEKFAAGAIRLVRVLWLLQQPDDYRIQNRQQLEQLERDGASPSPLLSPDEAVALVRRCARAAGSLTYGWLSPPHPDPAGTRTRVVRAALEANGYIEALFWDYASLYQGNRTPEQNALFFQALSVMGDLYASAVGTTVLQL